jgi:hypothetical protein
MLRSLKARKTRNRGARPIVLLAAALLAPSFAGAANSVGFASLKIGIGTRECGMGDAGTASAIGPQSIYWNPALNGWENRFGASISYSDWFLDMNKAALFVVRPTPIANVGLGATVFNAGKLEYRDEYPDDEPLGTFSPFDYSIYVNLSRALPRNLVLGGTGRYYYQKILDHSSHGWGADLGLAFEPVKNLKLAGAIMDFGSTLQFRFADYSLPTRAVVGASYALPLGWTQVNLAADGGFGFFDRQFALNAGAEVLLGKVVSVRGGYKILDQTAGLTLGVGFRVKGIRIDYAFGAHDLSLGATHRFSVGFGY